MKNLLQAALLPALTALAGQASSSLSVSNGAYAGMDLSEGQTLAGVRGRLNPHGMPVQFVPSFEGAPRSEAGRWQFNADVLSHVPAGAPLAPYMGAGFCVVGASGQKGVGLNLMGGANLALGPLNSFVQLRLTVADGVHLSLTAGALP